MGWEQRPLRAGSPPAGALTGAVLLPNAAACRRRSPAARRGRRRRRLSGMAAGPAGPAPAPSRPWPSGRPPVLGAVLGAVSAGARRTRGHPAGVWRAVPRSEGRLGGAGGRAARVSHPKGPGSSPCAPTCAPTDPGSVPPCGRRRGVFAVLRGPRCNPRRIRVAGPCGGQNPVHLVQPVAQGAERRADEVRHGGATVGHAAPRPRRYRVWTVADQRRSVTYDLRDASALRRARSWPAVASAHALHRPAAGTRHLVVSGFALPQVPGTSGSHHSRSASHHGSRRSQARRPEHGWARPTCRTPSG